MNSFLGAETGQLAEGTETGGEDAAFGVACTPPWSWDGGVRAGCGGIPRASPGRDEDNGPMRFLGHVIVTGLALWVTALILPGMHLGDDSATALTQVLTIGAIALILALINTIVKPILSFLAFPITCVTLGLFQLVINTLMLLLTSWVSGLLGLTLDFDSFWWALLAGIIIGVLSAIVEAVTGLGDDRDDRRREVRD